MAAGEEYVELGGVKLPMVQGSLKLELHAQAAAMRRRWSKDEELEEVREIGRRHLQALVSDSERRRLLWRNWFASITRCRPAPEDPPREIPPPSIP